jgi:hypothetical protein
MSDNNQPYGLRFTLKPAESRSIIVGLLELTGSDCEIINSYRASSSQRGKQYWGSWRYKSGLIPPDEPYKVATTPIMMPENPGVRGEFFPITPFSIDTIGDERGDFGIHQDANAADYPGTLGCIFPISKNGWNAIKRDFAHLASVGVESLPMTVTYSR